MKLPPLIILCAALTAPPLLAAPEAGNTNNQRTAQKMADAEKKHAASAKKLSLEQDDLSADVQDLLDEQTNPEVVKLLAEIEVVMGEATDRLEQTHTDGTTIAVETEVIEKIFEAAKKKKQKSGSGKDSKKSMGSMLEMMQNMMEGGKDVGKKPGKGKKPGEGEGEGEGPGGGGTGSGNGSGQTGSPDNTAENSQRRVPKNSGNAGGSLPREFQKAMDAYNKGAQDTATKPQR